MLATLKRAQNDMSSYQRKMFKVDDHMGIAIAGLTADGRVLCKYMRNECINHRCVHVSCGARMCPGAALSWQTAVWQQGRGCLAAGPSVLRACRACVLQGHCPRWSTFAACLRACAYLWCRFVYETPMPVGRLVRQVADKHQVCTQRSWKRPFGVGMLVGGYDKTGPHLYNTCPSGNYYEYKAMAIGARSQVGPAGCGLWGCR